MSTSTKTRKAPVVVSSDTATTKLLDPFTPIEVAMRENATTDTKRLNKAKNVYRGLINQSVDHDEAARTAITVAVTGMANDEKRIADTIEAAGVQERTERSNPTASSRNKEKKATTDDVKPSRLDKFKTWSAQKWADYKAWREDYLRDPNKPAFRRGAYKGALVGAAIGAILFLVLAFQAQDHAQPWFAPVVNFFLTTLWILSTAAGFAIGMFFAMRRHNRMVDAEANSTPKNSSSSSR